MPGRTRRRSERTASIGLRLPARGREHFHRPPPAPARGRPGPGSALPQPNASRSGSAASADRGTGVLPAAASVLLGATTAAVVSGLVVRFARWSADGGGLAGEAVVGASIMALALGVRVPQRFAVWLCLRAWQRLTLRGEPSDLSRVWLQSVAADRPLYWVVLSVVALVVGVLIALLPLGVQLAAGVYAWLHVHFVWSVGPLAILNAGVVLLAAVLPLTLLGSAISCVHHLSCPSGRWDTRATGWLLIGAAAGSMGSIYLARLTGRPDLLLVTSALPVLLLSLMSAACNPAGRTAGDTSAVDEPAPLPVDSDRWPTLLRATIVAVSVCGVASLCVWSRARLGAQPPVAGWISALLMSAGAGMLVGCYSHRAVRRSIGGFGGMCAASGVLLAFGTLGLDPRSRMDPRHLLAVACIALAVLAYTAAYGRQTLLNRVANRSFVGATILSRELAWGGLMIWIGIPFAVRVVGALVTLVAIALTLLSVGGVLIIHEPGYTRTTRRLRLCAVFGSIGTMIVVARTASGGG